MSVILELNTDPCSHACPPAAIYPPPLSLEDLKRRSRSDASGRRRARVTRHAGGACLLWYSMFHTKIVWGVCRYEQGLLTMRRGEWAVVDQGAGCHVVLGFTGCSDPSSPTHVTPSPQFPGLPAAARLGHIRLHGHSRTPSECATPGFGGFPNRGAGVKTIPHIFCYGRPRWSRGRPTWDAVTPSLCHYPIWFLERNHRSTEGSR